MSNVHFGGDQINVSGSGNIGKVVGVGRPSRRPPLRSGSSFVCYARVDQARVEPIAAALRSHGHGIWFDSWDLPAGANWRAHVTEAISTAICVVTFFSTASAQRFWSEQATELSYIRDQRMARELPVVSVRLDACEVPAMPIGPEDNTLADLQFFDLFPLSADRVAGLISAIDRAVGRSEAG